MAGQERRNLVERTKRGLQSRIAEGKWVQGAAPYGYRRSPLGYLDMDEIEANVVRSIFTDYVERRQGVRLLQKRLSRTVKTRTGRSVWSQSVIHRMLSSPIYIGRHTSGIKSPPIVSEELFNRAKARLARNRRLNRHTERVTPLQGLVGCTCGANWRIERAKPARNSPAYMYCFHRRGQSNWVTTGNPPCTVSPIRLDKFEQAVHHELKETFSDPGQFKMVVENTINDLNRELKEKQADVQPLREELANVVDRIAVSVVNTLKERLAKMNSIE